MDMIRVEGLEKQYPGFVLQNICFTLGPGRIMGLIGKNGAGKSTTLKSMLNLVSPSGGTVTIFERNFYQNEIWCKQQMGVVLGEIDFYKMKKLAVITDVTKRFYQNWDDAAYERYMKEFELDSQKQVAQLSSGMKVKYMLALALSHRAKLLVLDEPTSGLDPVARDDLLSLFRSIVADGSRSILFSTHITADLEKCADDIAYIHQGRLLACAPKNTFVQSFEALKQPGEAGVLSLEEIMLRTERKTYHV